MAIDIYGRPDRAVPEPVADRLETHAGVDLLVRITQVGVGVVSR